MSLILSSQTVILGTVIMVSSAVLILAFSKQLLQSPTNLDSDQPSRQGTLRSCMYSHDKKKLKKKNKRVKFAENVKDPGGDGKRYRREHRKASIGIETSCRKDIQGMPANRVALYNGILRDRLHRMQCHY